MPLTDHQSSSGCNTKLKVGHVRAAPDLTVHTTIQNSRSSSQNDHNVSGLLTSKEFQNYTIARNICPPGWKLPDPPAGYLDYYKKLLDRDLNEYNPLESLNATFDLDDYNIPRLLEYQKSIHNHNNEYHNEHIHKRTSESTSKDSTNSNYILPKSIKDDHTACGNGPVSPNVFPAFVAKRAGNRSVYSPSHTRLDHQDFVSFKHREKSCNTSRKQYNTAETKKHKASFDNTRNHQHGCKSYNSDYRPIQTGAGSKSKYFEKHAPSKVDEVSYFKGLSELRTKTAEKRAQKQKKDLMKRIELQKLHAKVSEKEIENEITDKYLSKTVEPTTKTQDGMENLHGSKEAGRKNFTKTAFQPRIDIKMRRNEVYDSALINYTELPFELEFKPYTGYEPVLEKRKIKDIRNLLNQRLNTQRPPMHVKSTRPAINVGNVYNNKFERQTSPLKIRRRKLKSPKSQYNKYTLVK